MPVKTRQNLAETDREPYYKEEWLVELLDSKGAFYRHANIKKTERGRFT